MMASPMTFILQQFPSLRFVLILLILNIVAFFCVSVPFLYKKNGVLQCSTFPRAGDGSVTLTSSNVHQPRTPQYYYMAILVSSAAESLDRRDGIRLSWMKNYKQREPKVLLQFSIGTANLPRQEKEKLKIEQDVHGDLLTFQDIHDSFSDLTKKVLASFVELDAHYNFSYILKCNDDTFVTLDKVLAVLRVKNISKSLYWGHHMSKGKVQKQGKQAESKWFLCETYVPFAFGFGYILSRNLVKKIASNADGVTLYNNEDVAVGTWIGPYLIERWHDTRFRLHDSTFDCKNDLVIQSQSTNQMMQRQKSLEEKGNVCI